MTYEVVREIEFCYGHRLLNYSGKCKNLHGHNGLAVIKIASNELDNLGMVIDFTKIKSTVANWINDTLDHKLILCKTDPLIPALNANNEVIYLMDTNPTAENIAKLIFNYAFKQNIDVTEVILWETKSCYASYKNT